MTSRLCFFVLLVGLVAPPAVAQTRTPTTMRAPAKPRPVPASKPSPKPTSAPAAADASPGEFVAQKGAGGTKVFRFGELEIEGRLKNPQLVFFLRRVRAEFAAGDLGHRSFLLELGDTKHDPNL